MSIAPRVSASPMPLHRWGPSRHYRLRAMRTAAILPVKRFAQAKQRLGASVADPLRLELARAMVGDVLAALTETAAIDARSLSPASPPWPTRRVHRERS